MLRNRPTEAERMLWLALRRQALNGMRFRRQQKIGRYVVDFFCPERKLIIEVDGRGHMKKPLQDSDKDEYLIACGYRVIRFWNDEILKDRESILERIRAGGQAGVWLLLFLRLVL